MMRRYCWVASLAILLIAAVGQSSATRAENYAFLVGVQDYDVKDLKKLNYTRNDIEQFATLLKESGFKEENIVLMTDKPDNRRFLAESERIRKQFGMLLATLQESDTLVVAFSGHGVQFEGEAKNYYCPADADLEDPKRAKLIAISEIYDRLKGCPAERKLLLVDACRNDPLSTIRKSRETVKLKSLTRPQLEVVPKGVVALFSCAAGQESYEWPELKHGIFFHHVLDGWKGAAADADQQVTLNGLVAYATSKTQTFARVKLDALQSPQLKSDFEGTWVLRKSSGDSPEISNSIGMKLRLIPKGTFTMGSPESEAGRTTREVQHRVTITKPFYLGKFEVTQGEWKAVMKTEPWKGMPNVQEADDYPAVGVSWIDAFEFCKRLSAQDGKTHRLPTEAEWEYACRGGDRSGPFHFGDRENELGDYAWIATNASEINEKYAHRVGLKRANTFGLHDMHGNVWEWCHDLFDPKYYENSPPTDPQGPEKGSPRVQRGGSWSGTAKYCRSAYRNGTTSLMRNGHGGFRVVQVLQMLRPVK